MATQPTADIIYATLKQLYHDYRHTEHIPSKGDFFSPTCMQVCRPIPNYAALRRETIVQYLLEAQGFRDVESYERAQSSSAAAEFGKAQDEDAESVVSEGDVKVKALKGKNYYSIRPLKSEEQSEILATDIVAPLGMTPIQLDEMRREEGWVGVKVDLWDEDADDKGRLIRVKYWWRKEEVSSEDKWLQCLHDIMSIGERDGSEGEGEKVLE